ncbi:unnamed protein product [Amoebophrya sp. A120]|nr:unnamed protein product [Amoebophrya sp. A120]|eukprot:GSA120T00001637001.1
MVRQNECGDMITDSLRLQNPDDTLPMNLWLALPNVIVHRIDAWSPFLPPLDRESLDGGIHQQKAKPGTAGSEEAEQALDRDSATRGQELLAAAGDPEVLVGNNDGNNSIRDTTRSNKPSGPQQDHAMATTRQGMTQSQFHDSSGKCGGAVLPECGAHSSADGVGGQHRNVPAATNEISASCTTHSTVSPSSDRIDPTQQPGREQTQKDHDGVHDLRYSSCAGGDVTTGSNGRNDQTTRDSRMVAPVVDHGRHHQKGHQQRGATELQNSDDENEGDEEDAEGREPLLYGGGEGEEVFFRRRLRLQKLHDRGQLVDADTMEEWRKRKKKELRKKNTLGREASFSRLANALQQPLLANCSSSSSPAGDSCSLSAPLLQQPAVEVERGRRADGATVLPNDNENSADLRLDLESTTGTNRLTARAGATSDAIENGTGNTNSAYNSSHGYTPPNAVLNSFPAAPPHVEVLPSPPATATLAQTAAQPLSSCSIPELGVLPSGNVAAHHPQQPASGVVVPMTTTLPGLNSTSVIPDPAAGPALEKPLTRRAALLYDHPFLVAKAERHGWSCRLPWAGSLRERVQDAENGTRTGFVCTACGRGFHSRDGLMRHCLYKVEIARPVEKHSTRMKPGAGEQITSTTLAGHGAPLQPPLEDHHASRQAHFKAVKRKCIVQSCEDEAHRSLLGELLQHQQNKMRGSPLVVLPSNQIVACSSTATSIDMTAAKREARSTTAFVGSTGFECAATQMSQTTTGTRTTSVGKPDQHLQGGSFVAQSQQLTNRSRQPQLTNLASTAPRGKNDQSSEKKPMMKKPPLRKILEHYLQTKWVEVLVVLDGNEPTTGHAVEARQSYRQQDIVWDQVFSPCVTTTFDDATGTRSALLDFKKFHKLRPFDGRVEDLKLQSYL